MADKDKWAFGQSSGFSFGNAASNAPRNTGFTFGTPNTTAAPFSAPSVAWPFGQTTTASSGFNFGTVTTAAATNTGFTFGTPTTTTAPFYAPSVAWPFGQTTTASSGFNFGAVTTAAATNTGFTFGAPTTAAGPFFGSSAAVKTTPISSTEAVTNTATTTKSVSFSFPSTTASTVNSTSTATIPATTSSSLLLTKTVAPVTTNSINEPFLKGPDKDKLVVSQPSEFAFGNVVSGAQKNAGFTFGAPTTTAIPFSSTSAAVKSTPSSICAQPVSSAMSTTKAVAFSVSSPAVTTNLTATTTVPATTSSLLLATTVAPVTTTTSSVSSTSNQMTFKQLEDHINIWFNELNQLEMDFQQQAQTINSWDSLLVNNALKITQVNEALERLKSDHTRIDHQLDFIVSQQNELDSLLEPLENIKIDSNVVDSVTTEREETYSLVEQVNNDLQTIGCDLQTFIKRLNETNASQDTNDPLSSVNKILNSHMDALQYIENQVIVLKANLAQN